MANWRKTRRHGKFTTTLNASGKSSVSQRVASGPNVNINRRYVRGGTITRTTYKSGDFIKVIQSSSMAKKSRSSSRNTSKRSAKSQKNELAMLVVIMSIFWGIFLIVPILIGMAIYEFIKFIYTRLNKESAEKEITLKRMINNQWFQFIGFSTILATFYQEDFLLILAACAIVFVPKIRHNLNLNQII